MKQRCAATRWLTLQHSVLFMLIVNGLEITAGPPMISVIPDQVILEMGHTPAIPFTVDGTNVTLSASSTDTLLVAATNIVFGGSGSSRTVTITAAPNVFGHTTITIDAVGDGGGAVTSFLLTINARLQIYRNQGQAVLTWTATNAVPQGATQIQGTWNDMFPAISSPYVVPIGGPQFFRLRQQ